MQQTLAFNDTHRPDDHGQLTVWDALADTTREGDRDRD